jgi:hypothetical protein
MPDAPGRTPPPETADALAALARQLDRLEGKVAKLDGLTFTVAGLAEEMAELVRAGGGAEAAPSWLWPVDPMELDDAESVLGQVMRWAGRVYLRYDDGALPECWLWHPDVIEELVWLRSAWQAAYHGPAASVARAGDWHDRQRPGVIRRIRAAAGSCSLREHLEPAPAPVVPVADAAAAVAAWWAESGPAPVPSGEQLLAADGVHRRASRRAGTVSA